jgi:hypothetical protein
LHTYLLHFSLGGFQLRILLVDLLLKIWYIVLFQVVDRADRRDELAKSFQLGIPAIKLGPDDIQSCFRQPGKLDFDLYKVSLSV